MRIPNTPDEDSEHAGVAEQTKGQHGRKGMPDDSTHADAEQSEIATLEPVEDVVGIGLFVADRVLFGRVAGQDEPRERHHSSKPGQRTGVESSISQRDGQRHHRVSVAIEDRVQPGTASRRPVLEPGNLAVTAVDDG